MVWLIEKKIFRYILDMGFERVEIPVRVKFEFEVLDGSFVPDTLTKKILYNQDAIGKRYPKIRLSSVENAIKEMVEDEIMKYIKKYGWLSNNTHDAI